MLKKIKVQNFKLTKNTDITGSINIILLAFTNIIEHSLREKTQK
jgi:hypothetical protein